MAREEGFKDGVLPQIHISGCPSSCGTHQTGIIGFHGGVKMIEKTARPAFTLHAGGCDLAGKERMGEQLGVILEENIPDFLRSLGRTVSENGGNFEEWLKKHPDGIREAAAGYLC
jgi:ferredoxin-nitrite reductase